jgi:uncharacterized protein
MNASNPASPLRHRLIAWAACLLTMLAIVPLTRAALTPIHDDGHFFSDDEIKQANDQVAAIEKQFHKDVVIETYATLPADLHDQYAKTAPADRDKFFKEWQAKRAHDLDVNGIYILICKDPSRLEIGVGNQTVKRAFTPDDRKLLVGKMLDAFKNKNDPHRFDTGLSDGLTWIHDAMLHNLGANAAPPLAAGTRDFGAGGRAASAVGRSPRSGLPVWLWIVIAMFGLFIVLRLVGRMAGGGGGGNGGGGYANPNNVNPGYGNPGYQGGGYGNSGGGFMRGLMGGVVGGAAGSWLYDRFNRPTGGQGTFSNPNADYSSGGGNFDTSSPPDTGNDQGQGFADNSGGGSFDSGGDSGGGDFGGGGDSGGGDFGGGDSGGGDAGGGSF